MSGARLGLEAHRNSEEARIVEHPAERVDAEIPLADMLVAIDARMEGLQRVVQMERDDPLDADVLVELVEGALVALVGAQIVAGRERVLGVEAQAQAVVLLDGVEDLRPSAGTM